MAALELSKGRDVRIRRRPCPGFFGDSLVRKRSPAISKNAFRKIPLSNLLTYRFFAGYPHWSEGSPQTAWSGLQMALPYELAVNGLNFNHFYLGGLHSAYVRGEALVATTNTRKPPPSFRRSSIIAGS